MLLPGVIKKSFTYGCFVDFPNSMVGLAPVRYLKDEFISDSSGIFSDKSTVIAKVSLSYMYNCTYTYTIHVYMYVHAYTCTCIYMYGVYIPKKNAMYSRVVRQ